MIFQGFKKTLRILKDLLLILHDFLRILEDMDEFNCTEFTIGDIVRSGFVRNYLINKTKMGIGMT